MKKLFFVLSLTVSSFAFAADEQPKTHDNVHAADTTSPACAVDKDPTKCEIHAGGGHKSHGKNKDWTHERVKQVEGVMPQPEQDKAKSNTPEMVTLSSPKTLASVNGSEVKLEWSKSENAKVYHVQVSKDAGFNNRSMYLVNNNAVTETSLQVTGLEPRTKYFWRVAAVNDEMKDSFTKSKFASSVFSTK